MLIKVWSKLGKDHLWAYDNFREEVGALLINYSLNGSIINSITYSVPNPIPQEIFDKYNFAHRIIDENALHEKYLPKMRYVERKYKIERYKSEGNIKTANEKCDSCLFWNDDKEICEKIGKCDMD